MIIDFDSNNYSETIDIDLVFDDFNYLADLKTLADISTDLSAKYEKINELTKLNIDIYKNIKEVTGK